MVLSIIFIILVGGISYYAANKVFFSKEEIIKSNPLSRIIFQITFIISNIVVSFDILQLIITINHVDLILWKLLQIFFSIFFYYLLPLYFSYNLFDYSKSEGILKIICIFLLHLYQISYIDFSKEHMKKLSLNLIFILII